MRTRAAGVQSSTKGQEGLPPSCSSTPREWSFDSFKRPPPEGGAGARASLPKSSPASPAASSRLPPAAVDELMQDIFRVLEPLGDWVVGAGKVRVDGRREGGGQEGGDAAACGRTNGAPASAARSREREEGAEGWVEGHRDCGLATPRNLLSWRGSRMISARENVLRTDSLFV